MTDGTVLIVKIGKLNYELPAASMAGLLDQLQTFADDNGTPVSLAVTILPKSAQQANDMITKVLQEFQR